MHLPKEEICRLACIPEESLLSKATCVKEAQEWLRALRSEAEKQMSSYYDSRLASSIFATFRTSLNSRLSKLRTALGLCRHCALPPAESYFSKITYDVCNPSEFEEGIEKLSVESAVRLLHSLERFSSVSWLPPW